MKMVMSLRDRRVEQSDSTHTIVYDMTRVDYERRVAIERAHDAGVNPVKPPARVSEMDWGREQVKSSKEKVRI